MSTGWWLLALGLGVVGYAYVLYPGLLWIAARLRRAAPEARVRDWPAVTITLPVYNEERVVADTIEALLRLDYPADRRHILVVSDASTDRTDEIVARFADRGVTLVRLPRRAGKTSAENAARAHFRGEIVVNTDASVRLAPQSLKALVAAFQDPAVGVASGRDVSVSRLMGDTNVGESGYVDYEMWVRALESRVGGIVGASGCFYASRAALHMEIVPEALSRDFAAPLIAREWGLRAVSIHEAVCFVPRVTSLRREYRRKVRTMTRGLETLFYKRHLLNPLRQGLFAWKLLSHKLVRWLVPWGVVLGTVGVALLAKEAMWARWLLAAGGFALGAAITAWYWPAERRLPRAIAMPAYVTWGIVAGMHSWINALRGELNPVWEPTRRDPVER